MRAREFLFEYRRDITAQKYGDKLLAAIVQMGEMYSSTPTFRRIKEILSTLNNIQFTDTKIVNFYGVNYELNSDNAAEVLEEVKPTLIETAIHYFERIVPDMQQYVPWMIKAFINDPENTNPIEFNEDDMLEKFDKYKHKLPPDLRDINRYKTLDSFKQMFNTYGHSLAKDETQINADYPYNDEDVRVVIPRDEEASCYYGRNTRWCTAYTKSENRFDQYNSEGPLYILIPKKPNHAGEKFQIHFPRGEWVEEDNSPVLLMDLIKRFPKFFQFLRDKDQEAKSLLILADPEELGKILHAINEKIEEHAYEYVNEMESEDEGWKDYQVQAAIDRGYFEGDPEDGVIDWDKVHEDKDLNDYLDYNDEARRIIRDAKDIAKLFTPEAIPRMLESDDNDDINYVHDLPDLYSRIMDEENVNDDFARDVSAGLVIRDADKYKEAQTGRTRWILHTPNFKVGWFS